MELVGQRAHGLGEELDRGGSQRQGAALGAHHGAGGLDDVAQVELAHGGHALLAQRIDAAEELDAVRGVLQLEESHLALTTLGADTAGDAVGFAVDVVLGKVGVALGEVCHVVGHVAVLGIGVSTGVDDGLAASEAGRALVVERGLGAGLLGHAVSFLRQLAGVPACGQSCGLARMHPRAAKTLYRRENAPPATGTEGA